MAWSAVDAWTIDSWQSRPSSFAASPSRSRTNFDDAFAVSWQSSFIQHERIGADNILLEADYPHCDSTWPHTQQKIHEQITGLPESVVRKVTWENAARLYQHPVPVAVSEDPNAF